MSIAIMTWIWRNSTTVGSDRLVLLALADSANDDGICWPSIATVAKKANLSRRYTQRIIQSLEEAGHIAIQHRSSDGLNTSSVYKVLTTNYTPIGGGSESERVVSNRPLPPAEVVAAETPGSVQETTTGNGQEAMRVVAYRPPKSLINRNLEPSMNQGDTPPPKVDPWIEIVSSLQLGQTVGQQRSLRDMISGSRYAGQEGETVIIACESQEQRDLLESRLTNLVTRQLIGMHNSLNVGVRFVVAELEPASG